MYKPREIKIERIKGEFRYILSNADIKSGDEVYPLGSGRCTKEHGYIWFNIRETYIDPFDDEPHIVKEEYEGSPGIMYFRTNHGYSPKESYFKIIDKEPIYRSKQWLTQKESDYNKAAVVILENEHGEYLMLNRVTKPKGWGFPGGKPEESDKDLFEETNISIHVNMENFIGTVASHHGNFMMSVFHVKVSDYEDFNIKLSFREHNGYVWTKWPRELKLAGATEVIVSKIPNPNVVNESHK